MNVLVALKLLQAYQKLKEPHDIKSGYMQTFQDILITLHIAISRL